MIRPAAIEMVRAARQLACRGLACLLLCLPPLLMACGSAPATVPATVPAAPSAVAQQLPTLIEFFADT